MRFAKTDRSGQGIFREQPDTVKIIKAVLAIEPSSHISLMGLGVTDYVFQTGTVVLALGLIIGHRNALSRFFPRNQIECEPIRTGLAESPETIGQGKIRLGWGTSKRAAGKDGYTGNSN